MLILYFQIAGMMLAIVFALAISAKKRRPLFGHSRILKWALCSRGVSVFLCGLTGFASSAAMSAVGGIPIPTTNDELSVLLGTDTFAHGRATNPTHPLWIHFESLHIFHEPTYATKYPPALSLLQAFGQVISGHPIVGVWLAMGLMSASACWMLQAFMPRRWALLGGILLAINCDLITFWGYAYAGAALAVVGSAIAVGAWRQSMRAPNAASSAILGLGLLLLANSRPFEGFATSIPIAIALLWKMVGSNKWPPSVSIRKVVLPAGLVLAAGGAAMLYYNDRVTHNVFKMPYAAHEDRYGVAPIFVFSKPYPVRDYNHDVMRYFQEVAAFEDYQKQQTFEGWLNAAGAKLVIFFLCYVQPALALNLLPLFYVLRGRFMKILAWGTATTLFATIWISWTLPYYGASAAAPLLVLIVQGMRHLQLFRIRGRYVGRFLIRSMLFVSFVSFGILLTLQYGKRKNPDTAHWAYQRERVRQHLERTDGKHLVVVVYGEQHNCHHEWVHNLADIDNTKVIWARPMDAQHNQALFEYFHDRRIWLVEADSLPIQLKELLFDSPNTVQVQKIDNSAPP